jgi:CheY-like chemotaxis protein
MLLLEVLVRNPPGICHMTSTPRTISILIADDNPRARKYLRTMLESWTHLRVCGEAIDGLDAIEKAKQLKPDLIVLDHSMPRMGGLAAARALRSADAQLSIVLLALFADTVPLADAKAAGINVVFSKEDVPTFMKYFESLLHSTGQLL